MTNSEILTCRDPLVLAKLFWPQEYYYSKQREMMYSVWNDDETYVVAANETGKDFMGGRIGPLFFLTRTPCRIVTTSATEGHLDVLWGEINTAIDKSVVPLRKENGGPLLCQHMHVRRVLQGRLCDRSYMTGMVAGPNSLAAMQGHHAKPDDVSEANDGVPRTLVMCDESSSVPDAYEKMFATWAQRKFIFGNAWSCFNFFKRGIRSGSIPDPNVPGRYYRRVIQIRATDHPNIRYALTEKAAGKTPSGRVLVPGKEWGKYAMEQVLWVNDPERISVSHDAEFYEGKGVMLFPKEWLDRAERIAAELVVLRQAGKIVRKAKAIGCDPAEGGDSTCYAVVDEYGLMDLISKKTPDTSCIVPDLIDLMSRYGVPAQDVCIDRGGGGKQHADALRAKGYNVRTVGFGEAIVKDIRPRTRALFPERVELAETKQEYKNRRAQLYGELRELVDPALNPRGFALPALAANGKLREQLSPIPLRYKEGVLFLPPKNRADPDSTEVTLTEIIGYSPDEADAVTLAVHAMLHEAARSKVGVF